MPSPHIVEIDKVSFGYDPTRPVLHDVSLRIGAGKVVGIMGQSGCGKTTLLRVIAGWLRPGSGSARALGRVLNDLGDAEIFALRRKMGMLFQFGALFTDMTGYENVAFQMREHTDLPPELVHDLAACEDECLLEEYHPLVFCARMVSIQPILK